MGKVLKTFKSNAVKSFITSVANGDIHAYVFTSGVTSVSNTVNESYDESVFRVQREMMFGHKLSTTGAYDTITANNMAFLTRRINWANNTVFDSYDNSDANIFESNNNFYVVTNSTVAGVSKDVYKCIWNKDGARSVINPSVAQSGNPIGGQFTTSDGYEWVYMYTITDEDWNKFAFTNYMPVFSNTIATSAASDGISFIKINNAGNGYFTKTGNVVSVSSNSVIQIGTTATVDSDLNAYANSYIFINIDPTLNNANTYLSRITTSYTNATTNYVFVEITPGLPDVNEVQLNFSSFKIGPYVKITGDGSGATAYANVSSIGTINYIDIKNRGNNYTTATVEIYDQKSGAGSGAVATASIAPPGGHGSNPITELGSSALGIYSKFVNNDVNFIPNVTYNTVGLLTQPKIKGNNSVLFTNGSFLQVMTVNLNSTVSYSNNEALTSSNGHTVYFLRTASTSNSAYFVGDKSISVGESLTNGSVSTTITAITSNGDLSAFGSEVLYINNLAANGITRTTSSNEEIKLAIQF